MVPGVVGGDEVLGRVNVALEDAVHVCWHVDGRRRVHTPAPRRRGAVAGDRGGPSPQPNCVPLQMGATAVTAVRGNALGGRLWVHAAVARVCVLVALQQSAIVNPQRVDPIIARSIPIASKLTSNLFNFYLTKHEQSSRVGASIMPNHTVK